MKKTNKRRRIVRSTVRALIPLDTEKIRKSELNKLKRSKKTCASLADQATQFEKKEIPAFAKWLQSECGELIQTNNTLRGKLSAVQNILYLTEDLCATFPQYTVKECADAAAHYIETKGEIPKGFEFFFEDEPADEFEDNDPLDEEEAEAARKFFDSLFDDFDDESDFDGPDPFAPTKQQQKKWAEEEKCIKKLYRNIIRKLHPDRAGSSTPEQQELWHAAKKAYDTNDLETLQHIEANCDLLNDKLIRLASISSIRSGTNFYKQTSTQIRRALRQLKQQPEWGFLSWTQKKKKSVLRDYTAELDYDLTMLSLQYSNLERRLKQMRKAPRKKVKKASTSHQGQAQFDLF